MKVYRISKQKFANDLTGLGASIVGGRWNSKGKSILYTASSRALAMLETLVRISNIPVPDFVIAEIEIPDDLVVTKIDPSSAFIN